MDLNGQSVPSASSLVKYDQQIGHVCPDYTRLYTSTDRTGWHVTSWEPHISVVDKCLTIDWILHFHQGCLLTCSAVKCRYYIT